MVCVMCPKRTMAILLCFILLMTSNLIQSAPQQFYPNGRFGRRSSMPSLQEVASGREMTVAFFGDGSVTCYHTGVLDIYRCGRNSDIESPLDF